MSKWTPPNEYVPVTKGSIAVVTLQSDGDVYGYMDENTTGVLLASASAGVTKIPTGSFSRITCTAPFILTTESALSRLRSGQGGVGFPVSYGTAKLFMTDDGKTVTFNFTEENPNGFPVDFSKLTAMEKLQGTLAGLTSLEKTFKNNKTIKIVDAVFPDVTSATSAFYDSSLTKIRASFPVATSFSYCFEHAPVESLEIDIPKAKTIDRLLQSSSATVETVTVYAPEATNFSYLLNNSTSINSAIVYVPNGTYYTGAFRYLNNLTYLKIGVNSLQTFKFTTAPVPSGETEGIGNPTSLETLEFFDNGLAACTSFSLTNAYTALTDTSIQNIVDALPDWTGTGTTALAQFPAGRLTAEQQATLTAKGWTWSEATE